MHSKIGHELAALQRLTVQELRAKFAEVFGEATPAHNKTWLIRRIAWRLQALAEGDLTARARQRAAELAHDADLRLNPPKASPPTVAEARTTTRSLRCPTDQRLPTPGTILTRPYKGQTVQVQVLSQGFAYAGEVYRSLSAVAQAITGSHCNGYLFFRLPSPGGTR
jgi:hypothetical protein